MHQSTAVTTGGGGAPHGQTHAHATAVGVDAEADKWLAVQTNLGRAAGTVAAYRRALHDYLAVCRRDGIDPHRAGGGDVAHYLRELSERRSGRADSASGEAGVGLANATIQQRLVALRLFYDHLVLEGQCTSNPVRRGYHPADGSGHGHQRGLVPRLVKQPWIPTDAQWAAILEAARAEPIRNRVMLGLGYDAGLRREELCSLRTDDIDPAYRTVRVRGETTKTRRGRVVPYSAACGDLLRAYLIHRARLSAARGALFLSESRRNRTEPITFWTWSKVVRGIGLRAGVPQFTTHTLRHLCLTDLARAGWELHLIAQFAGHRNPTTTLQYIHLSGRELAAKLAGGMQQIHGWRLAHLVDVVESP